MALCKIRCDINHKARQASAEEPGHNKYYDRYNIHRLIIIRNPKLSTQTTLFLFPHRDKGIPVYSRAVEITLIQKAADLLESLLLLNGFHKFRKDLKIQ